jgi:hypothetical protein
MDWVYDSGFEKLEYMMQWFDDFLSDAAMEKGKSVIAIIYQYGKHYKGAPGNADVMQFVSWFSQKFATVPHYLETYHKDFINNEIMKGLIRTMKLELEKMLKVTTKQQPINYAGAVFPHLEQIRNVVKAMIMHYADYKKTHK